MKLSRLALLLLAACGGHVATETTPDAGTDAAVSASTGICVPAADGNRCVGDPNCCPGYPIRAYRVDLARGCIEQPEVAVACYPPSKVAGQCDVARPTTGDPACFVHLSTGEVFTTEDDLFDKDGFAPCDAATTAAVANVHGTCP